MDGITLLRPLSWVPALILAAALTGCGAAQTRSVEVEALHVETISDYESPPWNTLEMINMDTEIVSSDPAGKANDRPAA